MFEYFISNFPTEAMLYPPPKTTLHSPVMIKVAQDREHNPPTLQAIASGYTPHMPMFGCHEIFTFQWGAQIFKWNSTQLGDWLGPE